MHKKIHVKTKNKICAAVLVFVLAGSLTAGACAVPNVYAKTEAEKKRDAYKKKLREKNSDIANIKDSQSDVKDSISVAAAKMKTLLSKQEQLKSDIKDKQNEVEQANKKLEEAKEEEQKQYDAMKLRIQYLYENSTDNSIWSAILESNGLSDMLNRIEYATDLYKSDRELMTSYQNAVKKVEDWTMQLADEMDSLLALQDKYQTQQGELKTLMAKLEKQKDAYAQQLAEAQKQAQDYKKTISKQEAIIRAQEAAAARANANTYDGGGTGAGARNRTDGIGQQGFLHLGHIAVLVHHAGPGGGAHQGPDGVEHVDHAEGEDQGDGGEPAQLHKAGEVELEQGLGGHVSNRGHPAGGGQGGEGGAAQYGDVPDPVDHGGDEHAQQHGGAHALAGQDDDGEQAHEGGDHGEHHLPVARLAHAVLNDGGGQGAEEVPHHVERRGEAVALGIDAHVGAQTDVHQHQADGGGDAVPHAQRDRLNDLVPDVQHGQDDEHDALDKDDAQGGLKGLQIAHAGQGHKVGHHHGKEAVQAHAGGHGEGLVGQEGHTEHAHGGREAGGHEHGVPKLLPVGAETGEQVGVQRDDVGHGHKGGQTGQDLGADVCAVLLQVKQLLHWDLLRFY